MLSRILPYLLAAAATALAFSENRRADLIQTSLSQLQGTQDQLVAENLSLAESVQRQNAQVLAIKSRAAQASIQAEVVIQTLPAKLVSDRRVRPEPKEMSEWISSLFSH